MRRFLHQTRIFSPLLLTRPGEFYDRLTGMVENELERFRKAPDYNPVPLDQAIGVLEACAHSSLQDYLREDALQEIERAVFERIQAAPTRLPFPKKHNADLSFARACYALVRAFAPAVTVETGVAYGITSAFILKALSMNGSGQLYSVDLPASIDDSAKQFVGYAIPDALRDRWQLHLGSSKRILPGLFRELKEVDVFIHDSLHTFGHMSWEYRLARRYLKEKSLLISDDIAGNAAFSLLVAEAKPDCWAAIREPDKKGAFAVAVFSDTTKSA